MPLLAALGGDAPVQARPKRTMWVLYGTLAVLLVGYFISLLVRPAGQTSPALDSWGVAGFEFMASVMCLARGLSRRSGRAVPLVLGTALVSWSLGDFLLAVESRGGVTPSVPSWADLLYLLFYPLTYIALMLLIRTQVRRFSPATWLDGAIAGLGAAAVCATFAFRSVLHSAGGRPIAVATNLAYPIGDALLLALVVAGSATLPGRKKASWILLAAGCGLNVAGDTANLFQTAAASSHLGTVINAIAWPTAILLMSAAVWIPLNYSKQRAPEARSGFVLPGLASTAALVIVCYAALQQVSRVALALGVATLVAAGIRMLLSLRSLRTLTEDRRYQAVTDALTGLGNRRGLSELLDGFFTEDDPTSKLAFLYIDLNHFKEINDAFGHSAGDQLLQQLGPRLHSALRSGDLLARIGGDEFAVILIDADAAHAEEVALRLAARFAEPFILDVVSVRVGASIGIALAPTDAMDGEGLLRCADAAMYRAKLSGAPFEYFQHELDTASDRLRLAEELRVALEHDQLVLHYQPQVDLPHGETLAVEALIRWFHPRLGSIPPLRFLPLAEEAGLMRALTALVLEKALAQCAAWRGEGRRVSVSVNISASNLLDDGFTDLVREALDRHDLEPDALTLEITETTIISDFDLSKQVIAQLSAIGVLISIDDFGAGFTSLAHLASLAVDELKLDRTFITQLAMEGDRAHSVLRATIDLGHAIGMRVVAEGVEDDETLQVLSRLGCDRVQGYLIGKPGPAAELRFRVPRPRVTAVVR